MAAIKGELNHRNRWIPAADPLQPFYVHAMKGLAMRNGHKMTERGWYFVDAENKLHGPYQYKLHARKASDGMQP